VPVITITKATDKHYTLEMEDGPTLFCESHMAAMACILDLFKVDLDDMMSEAKLPPVTDRVWCPVEEKLPENNCPVLAYYKNSCGMGRIIKAIYVREFEIGEPWDLEIDGYCADQYDYKEDDIEKENAYLPEGWYEVAESAENYMIPDHQPTHWMNMPKPPEDK